MITHRSLFKPLWASLLACLVPNLSVAGEVHFFGLDGRPALFARSERDLRRECVDLQRYVAHRASRNTVRFAARPERCSTVLPANLSRLEGRVEFPTYSSTSVVRDRALESSGFMISIADWFPADLWARRLNAPQDTECHNATLVDSGILREANSSRFLTSIDFFLGMRGFARVAPVSADERRLVYGPKSDSPLVTFRRTIPLSGRSKEEVRRELGTILATHFSPGSVMCVSIDPRQRKEDLVRTERSLITQLTTRAGGRWSTNIRGLPNDFESESGGGHCLTFMTPRLIVEANKYLPRNFLNVDVAFDFYFDLIRNTGVDGRLHYFQLDSTAVARGAWVESQIASHRPLKVLLDLASRHRALYENPSFVACPHSDQFAPYESPDCQRVNPDVVARLRDFWSTAASSVLEGPDLRALSPHVDSSDGGTLESQLTALDRVALDTLRLMRETRESLVAQ